MAFLATQLHKTNLDLGSGCRVKVGRGCGSRLGGDGQQMKPHPNSHALASAAGWMQDGEKVATGKRLTQHPPSPLRKRGIPEKF